MENNIVSKLRLDKYNNIVILDKPKEIEYFDELIFDDNVGSLEYDCIIVFVMTLEQMKEMIMKLYNAKSIVDKGRLFFAYPKKGNKKYDTFIERDSIFPFLNVDDDGYIKDLTYKFSRMVSLDETFTIIGITNEVKKVKRNKSSLKVDDYITLIEPLKDKLSIDQEALDSFNKLTNGYKKDWARYVYSAKTQATIDKRIHEAIDILKLGFKSVTLLNSREHS